MSTDVALWLAIGAGVLAVLYGVFSVGWINRQPAGRLKAPGPQIAPSVPNVTLPCEAHANV